MSERRACVSCDEIYIGSMTCPACADLTGEPLEQLVELVTEVVNCWEQGQELSPAFYAEALATLEKASPELQKSTPISAQS